MSDSGCEEMPTDSPSSIQKRAWMAWRAQGQRDADQEGEGQHRLGHAHGQARGAQAGQPRPRARDGRSGRAHAWHRATIRQPPAMASVCTPASPPRLSRPGTGVAVGGRARAQHDGRSLGRRIARSAGGAHGRRVLAQQPGHGGHLERAGVGGPARLQTIRAAGLRDGAGEAVGEPRLVVDGRPDRVEALTLGAAKPTAATTDSAATATPPPNDARGQGADQPADARSGQHAGHGRGHDQIARVAAEAVVGHHGDLRHPDRARRGPAR